MQHHYFTAIAGNPKLRHLLINGACIGQREIQGFAVLLFQVSAGYYEVVLNPEGSQVISYWHFTDTEDLEPYLKSIPIPDLS